MFWGTFGQSFYRDEPSILVEGTFGESFYRNLCFGKQFRFQARGTWVRHSIEKRSPNEPKSACSKDHEELKSNSYGRYEVACWRKFGDGAQTPHLIGLPRLP